MDEVLLGLPGPWAQDNREESDHYTTKIGGLPDWPIQDIDIGPEVLNCRLCGERLCLIAQVYAPVSTPKLNIQERVIYVFGCRMPKCGSNPRSWRAIRVQKCCDEKQFSNTNKETMTLKKDSTSVAKSDLLSFGESDNESDDDIDLEELARAFSDIGAQVSKPRKLDVIGHSKDDRNAIVSKQRSVDADNSRPVIPCFYIYSQKEQSRSDVSVVCSSYSALSIEDIGSPSKDNDDEERWERENYEYDRALNADRTYLKFKKQLDLLPEQCFRYSYGGKPLLAKIDAVEPDNCRLCGSSRKYEMQLMSPLLYFLHEAADGPSTYIPEEWNWMTLILYTCSSSCCPSSCKHKSSGCSWAVAEEAIIVQDE